VPTGKFLNKPEVIMGRKDIKRIRALADKYNLGDSPLGITPRPRRTATTAAAASAASHNSI